MLDRGHQRTNLIPIFEQASIKVETSAMPNPKNEHKLNNDDDESNERQRHAGTTQNKFFAPQGQTNWTDDQTIFWTK
jgi:hypothetical protein